MWAIEASPSPKAAYRWGWYHFEPGYTTCLLFWATCIQYLNLTLTLAVTLFHYLDISYCWRFNFTRLTHIDSRAFCFLRSGLKDIKELTFKLW